jgi:hypothetical protein
VVSTDFNRHRIIDLGRQPWPVISLWEESTGHCQADAGGDHAGSIPDLTRAASTTSPWRADDLAVDSGEGLQSPGRPT